jgi:hypothetical protein
MAEGDENNRFIEVLFHEYDALRKEIVARTTGGYQLVAVIALILTWFLTSLVGLLAAEKIRWPVVALVVGAAFLIAAAVRAYFRISDYEIKKAAARVREIENEINFYCDRHLLRWETFSGTAMTGFWKRNARRRYPAGEEPPQFTQLMP